MTQNQDQAQHLDKFEEAEVAEMIIAGRLKQYNGRKQILVFGSNERGVHGAGSAREAANHWGAQPGVGIGLVGNSYALPTKYTPNQTLGLPGIEKHVDEFLRWAEALHWMDFNVVAIGCGLAGFKPMNIAPMFCKAPSNVRLPHVFLEVLSKMSANDWAEAISSVLSTASEGTQKPVVSETSWRGYSNTIHAHFMKQMGLPLGSAEEIGFLGLELAGETGELCNNIKKYWRDGPSEELNAAIQKEVADVEIMFHHIKAFFMLNGDVVASRKVEELFTRWPHIEKLYLSTDHLYP